MIINTADNLRAFARQFADVLQAGDVLLLCGELGAGKTTFVQGLAEGLAISEGVDSPTFVLIQSYESGKIPLHHMDMYRITDENSAYELGLEEYFYGDGITVVEWPEMISSFLPTDALTIRIEKMPEGRALHFSETGTSDILQRKGVSHDISH